MAVKRHNTVLTDEERASMTQAELAYHSKMLFVRMMTGVAYEMDMDGKITNGGKIYPKRVLDYFKDLEGVKEGEIFYRVIDIEIEAIEK